MKVYKSRFTEKQECTFVKLLRIVATDEWIPGIKNESEKSFYLNLPPNEPSLLPLVEVKKTKWRYLECLGISLVWLPTYEVYLGRTNRTKIGSTRTVRAEIKKLFNDLEIVQQKKQEAAQSASLKEVKEVLKAHFETLDKNLSGS